MLVLQCTTSVCRRLCIDFCTEFLLIIYILFDTNMIKSRKQHLCSPFSEKIPSWHFVFVSKFKRKFVILKKSSLIHGTYMSPFQQNLTFSRDDITNTGL